MSNNNSTVTKSQPSTTSKPLPAPKSPGTHETNTATKNNPSGPLKKNR
ncbi:hypothetical protein hrd7_25010 [Leptolinea sp. HRD-7]|nr:hypothetical protein hrd7_25010 [Leptolinea sp. HRD-7]